MQAESAEDYLKALTARVAYVNVFENVDLAFRPDARKAYARMDKERFADILIDILERFAGARMREIEVATALNDWMMVRITGRGECTCHPLSQSSRFFERSLALCGGLMQASFEANSPYAEIEFSTLQEE